MLELNMHEAQMMKQQGKKIYESAATLGKSNRTIHYYLSEPSRSRKKRTYSSKLDPFKPYIDTILKDDPSFNREVLHRNLKKQKYIRHLLLNYMEKYKKCLKKKLLHFILVLLMLLQRFMHFG